MSFGFIFPRHVQRPEHNDLWIECYRCIRDIYPDAPFIIIDDNSVQEHVRNDVDLYNTTVIQSEFPGAGEFLPFYYFYTLKPFDTAIILHDSMFVRGPLSVHVDDVAFLWHFNCNHYDDPYHQAEMYSALHHSQDLKTLWRGCRWIGCFGSACIIRHDFLVYLEAEYNFMALKNIIRNRSYRCALERVFAVMCHHVLQRKLKVPRSIFGDIHYAPKSFRLSYNDYKESVIPGTVVKVWNGR